MVFAPGSGPGGPAPQADLFAQVTQVLHILSVDRPLFLAIDDLQWADGGTTALLFHLGRRLAGSRILLACAYRPEALGTEEGGQAVESGIGTVLQELCRIWGDVLVDLDQADGRAFIEAYIDSEPNRLGAAFRQALYDHTGGNPLFTVELLRGFEREGALVQDEAGRWIEVPGLDWKHWSPQVEAVIVGHLAVLPDEDRVLLQAASVQGEKFAAEVVARVLAWSEEAAVRRLSGSLRTRHRLVSAVSLDRLPSSGQRLSQYRFRHSLLHKSAYRNLDAVERVRLHEATGRALEAIYAHEDGQSLAPELAHHFEAAGLPLEAARYRLEAGRWAVRLVAYDEALTHLERGLALLEEVVASRERLHLELALCLALVIPTSLRWGWQSPALARALQRLSDLTQHSDLQDDPQRLIALTALAASTTWSASPERGQRVAEQLLDLVQDGDRQSLTLALCMLGHSLCLRGKPIAAREHLDQALSLYDPKAGRPLGLLLGVEPSVTLRAMLGLTLWLLGYPDQGRDSLQQALTHALEIEQPSSAAFAHLVAGFVFLLLGRDVAAALTHSQALRSLSSKAGLIYDAWAKLLAGQVQDTQAGAAGPKPGFEQDLAQAAGVGSAFQAAGSGVGQAGQLLVQAQMLVRAGQPRMAMEVVDQALAWIERTGVRVMEAEVWRVRGELLLLEAAGAPHLIPAGEAQANFRRALEVARGQQARWLELRAGVSMARLWQAQGRRDKARELLVGIYGWFSEGFDTADLKEAQALLKELS
jgi:tetratricopeptide (TPR) repeat protein